MKKLFLILIITLSSFIGYSQSNVQTGEVVLIDGWFKVGNDTINYNQFKQLWLDWKGGYYSQTEINDTLAAYSLKTQVLFVSFTRELVAADIGNVLRVEGDVTLEIPQDFSSMEIGESIAVLNSNANANTLVVIEPLGSVTLNGSIQTVSIPGERTSAVLIKTGTNTYELY